MRNALVVACAMGLMTSCGAAPAETAWVIKAYNTWCDKVHSCLTTDAQRQIQFSFYLGNNAGDCKAAFGDERADVTTQTMFSQRKLVQAEADKCVDAVAKLTCGDVMDLLALNISIPNTFGGMIQQTASDDAHAKLGVDKAFSCQADQTTCRADAGCSLSTTAGACAVYNWAPYKDGNLAAKETEAYTMTGGGVIGCGQLPIGL